MGILPYLARKFTLVDREKSLQNIRALESGTLLWTVLYITPLYTRLTPFPYPQTRVQASGFMRDTDLEDGLNLKTRCYLIVRVNQSKASHISFFCIEHIDEG